MSEMAKVIDLFTGKERPMTPEQRAHLMQRAADLAMEVSLKKSELEALERRLNG